MTFFWGIDYVRMSYFVGSGVSEGVIGNDFDLCWQSVFGFETRNGIMVTMKDPKFYLVYLQVPEGISEED